MKKRPRTSQQKVAERAKRKARYGKHWDEIRQQVYQRDGFHCRACGRGPDKVKKLNAHHILLLRVSQTNDARNLITLCDRCHQIVEARALGMLKRGQHRSDIVRMTHRWLVESRAKAIESLIEEVNAQQFVPGNSEQNS